MNISTPSEPNALPPDLPLSQTWFYSGGSSVLNISTGVRFGYHFVAFDYDSNGELSRPETVIAFKTDSPKIPDTNLSQTSGLRLERVGGWIFALEPQRVVNRNKIDDVLDEIIKLLEYAKDFPQNL